MSSSIDMIYDVVGLGFGPANIAIAGAINERRESNPSSDTLNKALFIEKHRKFKWHPGMLLPGARMQISFMKDLATLRNPQSPYTFLSYLQSQGRLLSFINRGSTVPTRKEFADYLAWAAVRVQEDGVDVLYGKEVVGLEKAADQTVSVRYRDVDSGEEVIVRTRNLIISPGGAPRVPSTLSSLANHPHVVHSSSYCLAIPKIMETITSTPRSKPIRIAVIGSGQSAAEVIMNIRSRLSDIPCPAGTHQVDMLIRKGSLKPSDDSPFANEIFNPEATDSWFSLPSRRVREQKLAEYKPTNYGVVNPYTLENLYETIYNQRLNEAIANRTGESAPKSEALINIKPYTNIISVESDGHNASNDFLLSTETDIKHCPLTVTSEHMISFAKEEETYDAIVYATGYIRSAWSDILKSSEIGEYYGLNSDSNEVRLVPSLGESGSVSPISYTRSSSPSTAPSSALNSPPTSPEMSPEMGVLSSPKVQGVHDVYISRNYRLIPETKGGDIFCPRIYLQGVEESSHGLSDTLLSVLGIRAGEVVSDLAM